MKVTLEQLVAELDKIVDEVGRDYACVSPSPNGDVCYYTWEGKPSCIIGKALVNMGVPPEEFGELEFMDAVGLPFWADQAAGELASSVQQRQDIGRTWADSVRESKVERGL